MTISEAVRQFTADPDSGRGRPKAGAALANGRARVTAGPFNWDVDLPPAIGGGNQAPSPTAYLLGALAACAVAYVADTLAPEFEVSIDDLSATASCATDLAGLVGIDGADPRLGALRLEVAIDSPSDPERIAALESAWRERCPIYLALVEATSVIAVFTASAAERKA